MAPGAVALRPGDTVYAGAEDAALFPLDRRRATSGGTLRPPRARLGAALAPRRAGDVPAHDPPSSRATPRRIFIAISSAGALPDRRRRRDVAADQPGAEVGASPDPDAEVGPLRPPDRDAPRALPGRALHAEALGRHAERRPGRLVARRSAGTCRPTSGSRSTSTPLSRRPSTSSRSRATPSTTRPRGSSASTGAGPAGTSEAPLTGAARALLRQRAPRRDGPSTCSTSAACTSARPAVRCTRRPTPGTVGLPSSATSRPWSPSSPDPAMIRVAAPDPSAGAWRESALSDPRRRPSSHLRSVLGGSRTISVLRGTSTTDTP